VKIPREAYAAPVDAAARLVLLLLWEYARIDASDPEFPFAWPSTDTLANELRCTERSVRRSLASLRSAGLVWPATRSGRFDDTGTGRIRRGWCLRAPSEADEIVRDPTDTERTIPSDRTDDTVRENGRDRPRPKMSRPDIDLTLTRQETTTPTPPHSEGTTGRKRSRKPRPVEQPDIRAVPVLEALDRERARHGLRPLPPSERSDRTIVARLDDGISVDELILAVELHSRATDGAGRLNATTPFTGPSARGPGGWSWSRRLIDEHQAAKRDDYADQWQRRAQEH